jgi:hypothetical protein
MSVSTKQQGRADVSVAVCFAGLYDSVNIEAKIMSLDLLDSATQKTASSIGFLETNKKSITNV